MTTTSTFPIEIWYKILNIQYEELMSNDQPPSPEKFDSNLEIFLKSNLLVNKYFYQACLRLSSRYCNFATAKRFNNFLQKIIKLKSEDSLANSGNITKIMYSDMIEIVDFSELTSIGLGRSQYMNKEIKNLTSKTLWKFLENCPNIKGFLANEHIQMDLDHKIISYLLNKMEALDFCGCTGDTFSDNFVKSVQHSGIDGNYSKLTKLGLNNCTDLPKKDIYQVLLKSMKGLRKLDLSRTCIDDRILKIFPIMHNLTHFSIGMCSNLTPYGILDFITYHPTMTASKFGNNIDNKLQWLNLQVGNQYSTWTSIHVTILLKKLIINGHNKTLKYLNLNGLPVTEKHLNILSENFPNLVSLHISDCEAPTSLLREFISKMKYLKFINLNNSKFIKEWYFFTNAKYELLNCSESLVSIELSFKTWSKLQSFSDNHSIMVPHTNGDTSNMIQWTCYLDSSFGRRFWIYRVDDFFNRNDLDTAGRFDTYDLHGNKNIEITRQPDFLKFAQYKVVIGTSIIKHPTSSSRIDDYGMYDENYVFDWVERGMYRYYSLRL
ncbi:Lug1p SCDLUD_000608 [Saccharomycodes ludwigii]|uniref:Lug1p n=1 Tax=Saccharomycodes ludwigii TaxID=36035 RepID=UPI001E85A6D2|nr:hypothetical protein SCDLUD_000608 [Saccharomycodes ludwigii]KAH3903004.1 hypothetical protein SCDLUD_000608 [Saccharomycodes ludwigii]